MEEMTTFSLASVPLFLTSSALYSTFVENEDSEDITLPAKHCYFDLLVDNPEQLRSIVSTLHFWGSREIPNEVFTFILENDTSSNAQVLEEFSDLNFKTVDILVAANMARRFHNVHGYCLQSVALQYDCLPLVKYIENYDICANDLLERGYQTAAQWGSIECLQYIHSKGGKLNLLVVDQAVRSRSLVCVKYCVDNGYGSELRLFHLEDAASKGDLTMLKYLYEQIGKWSHAVCTYAARSKSLDCLRYARENEAPWDERTFEVAVQGGSLEMVTFLHEHQCPSNDYVCDEAAAFGHLPVLMFLKEHGYKLSYRTCESAARKGHLDCLKYAQGQGCRLSSDVMHNAALEGHLHIIQYGAELNILKCSATLCQAAASQGHTEVMIFAHQQGCVINADTIERAASNGNIKAVEYLIDQNCTGLQHAGLFAAQKNQIGVLKLLLARGCPLDERVTSAAARHGHLECLQFLHENGCPWSKRTCVSAMYGDHFACFKYAVLHGCPVDWEVEETASREANKAFINFLNSGYELVNAPAPTREEIGQGCMCVIC